MSDPRTRVSPDEMAALDVENGIEYLLHLGSSPLAQRAHSDELAWVITGIDDNSYNGVAWFRVANNRADAMIEAIIQRFRRLSMPSLWFVDSVSQPADLEARLQAHGCLRLDDGVGMVADLTMLNEETRSIPDLEIRRVQDGSDLARWCDIYASDDSQGRESLYGSLGFGVDQPLHHYLALLDGVPVGTSSVFLGKRSAGIYHVEVKPEARRRGIGTALTLAPLLEARRRGYRLGNVGPSLESQHMYQRLGFVLYPNVHTMYAISGF